MAYNLGGTDLQVITSENATKDSGIIVLDIVQSDSSEAIAVQLSGAIENISVSGTIIKDTTAELRTFIDAISLLANGNANATSTYNSDLIGSRNVIVVDFRWSWAAGRTTELNYSIKMTTSVI